MIIDIHTHTPTHREAVPAAEETWTTVARPDRHAKVTVSWDEYDERARQAGVDISVVFNIATLDPGSDTGLPGDPARINDTTAEFVAAAPDRRIGFLSVHPEHPAARDEFERSVSDLGLRGVKLGPNYQNFDPLGDAADWIYGEAERRGMPILFHQGASPIRHAPLRYAHPLTIDQIAIRHPDLRIVMAHMGHPWQADTIVVIRKHPNVYGDVSALYYRPWSFYSGMRLATEWSVLHKLLLGSDYPIIDPQETIDGLRHVNDIVRGTALPTVPEDALEEIIHRDSLALLGLRPESSAQ
ncbi:MAG TPA: amidohydrolase family protein [Candidatus Dormibacteraeota bacterium]|nr:amidohydrolase family protein [Candidatus Dormibacteraeota bacterium]